MERYVSSAPVEQAVDQLVVISRRVEAFIEGTEKKVDDGNVGSRTFKEIDVWRADVRLMEERTQWLQSCGGCDESLVERLVSLKNIADELSSQLDIVEKRCVDVLNEDVFRVPGAKCELEVVWFRSLGQKKIRC